MQLELRLAVERRDDPAVLQFLRAVDDEAAIADRTEDVHAAAEPDVAEQPGPAPCEGMKVQEQRVGAVPERRDVAVEVVRGESNLETEVGALQLESVFHGALDQCGVDLRGAVVVVDIVTGEDPQSCDEAAPGVHIVQQVREIVTRFAEGRTQSRESGGFRGRRSARLLHQHADVLVQRDTRAIDLAFRESDVRGDALGDRYDVIDTR